MIDLLWTALIVIVFFFIIAMQSCTSQKKDELSYHELHYSICDDDSVYFWGSLSTKTCWVIDDRKAEVIDCILLAQCFERVRWE